MARGRGRVSYEFLRPAYTPRNSFRSSTPTEITESESLLIGRNFGVGTDVQTAPNGNLFILSLSKRVVYEVFNPER